MTRIATWNSARDVWETEAVSLLSGRSDVYSGIFPILGMTVNGVAYELPTSAHPTDGSESLFSQLGGKLIPTPRASDGEKGGPNQRGSKGDLTVSSAVALLPSPAAQPSGNSPEDHLRKKPGHERVTDLAIIVENGLLETGGKLLPTPRSNEANGVGEHGTGGADLRTTIDALLPTPKAGDADFGMPRTSGRPPEKSTHLMTRMEYTKPDESWGPYAAAIARWESVLGRPAPAPTEEGPKGGRRLSSLLVEWMMGLPEGWVTGRGLPRTAELKMLGNGVVPQQAIAALRSMVP